MNQAFVRATRDLVVLADHTKWGTRGLAIIAPLDAASTVVSDDAMPAAGIAAFESIDTELVLASPATVGSLAAT